MGIIGNLKAKNPNLWQIISYALLSLVASAVELAVFALSNYLLFTRYRAVGFRFWVLDYSAGNGGLCYFLAIVVSFVSAQVVNFFLQRKKTFAANNNPVKSGILYALMMTGVFALQMWLPGVLRAPFASAMGEGLAELILKLLGMFLAFAITYPLNKFVIMRRDK